MEVIKCGRGNRGRGSSLSRSWEIILNRTPRDENHMEKFA